MSGRLKGEKSGDFTSAIMGDDSPVGCTRLLPGAGSWQEAELREGKRTWGSLTAGRGACGAAQPAARLLRRVRVAGQGPCTGLTCPRWTWAWGSARSRQPGWAVAGASPGTSLVAGVPFGRLPGSWTFLIPLSGCTSALALALSTAPSTPPLGFPLLAPRRPGVMDSSRDCLRRPRGDWNESGHAARGREAHLHFAAWHFLAGPAARAEWRGGTWRSSSSRGPGPWCRALEARVHASVHACMGLGEGVSACWVGRWAQAVDACGRGGGVHAGGLLPIGRDGAWGSEEAGDGEGRRASRQRSGRNDARWMMAPSPSPWTGFAQRAAEQCGPRLLRALLRLRRGAAASPSRSGDQSDFPTGA